MPAACARVVAARTRQWCSSLTAMDIVRAFPPRSDFGLVRDSGLNQVGRRGLWMRFRLTGFRNQRRRRHCHGLRTPAVWERIRLAITA